MKTSKNIFAAKCSVTGRVMNKGWRFNGWKDISFVKNDYEVLHIIKGALLDDLGLCDVLNINTLEQLSNLDIDTALEIGYNYYQISYETYKRIENEYWYDKHGIIHFKSF